MSFQIYPKTETLSRHEKTMKCTTKQTVPTLSNIKLKMTSMLEKIKHLLGAFEWIIK
jgi:hypothetical protein